MKRIIGVAALSCVLLSAAVSFGQALPRGMEKVTSVEGTIKTTYTVVHGSEFLCGATWVQVPPAGLELVALWIEANAPMRS